LHCFHCFHSDWLLEAELLEVGLLEAGVHGVNFHGFLFVVSAKRMKIWWSCVLNVMVYTWHKLTGAEL
jgi:hypothetical protein